MGRLGECHPNDLDGMQRSGLTLGLAKARELGSAGILDAVEKAGLRGRGAQVFRRLQVACGGQGNSPVKYVVANADEGDAGTSLIVC
ncbi:MAG: hypothetical protein CM1200mP29_04320 [Verrucomicrobiota bacterium]|nr:MAG: hypothetical protein CM1200mP29_04320 [Verrucomicrobiota bacterium]